MFIGGWRFEEVVDISRSCQGLERGDLNDNTRASEAGVCCRSLNRCMIGALGAPPNYKNGSNRLQMRHLKSPSRRVQSLGNGLGNLV